MTNIPRAAYTFDRLRPVISFRIPTSSKRRNALAAVGCATSPRLGQPRTERLRRKIHSLDGDEIAPSRPVLFLGQPGRKCRFSRAGRHTTTHTPTEPLLGNGVQAPQSTVIVWIFWRTLFKVILAMFTITDQIGLRWGCKGCDCYCQRHYQYTCQRCQHDFGSLAHFCFSSFLTCQQWNKIVWFSRCFWRFADILFLLCLSHHLLPLLFTVSHDGTQVIGAFVTLPASPPTSPTARLRAIRVADPKSKRFHGTFDAMSGEVRTANADSTWHPLKSMEHCIQFSLRWG